LDALDAEAAAEILEERDAELSAGLHQAEQHVAGLAAALADSSARHFALGDDCPDVVFRTVGV